MIALHVWSLLRWDVAYRDQQGHFEGNRASARVPDTDFAPTVSLRELVMSAISLLTLMRSPVEKPNDISYKLEN